MSIASAEKLPSLRERCMNGTPKIQLDLSRINRLASLVGLPRRVPCADHGRGGSPAENVNSKNQSPCSKEDTATRGQDLSVTTKNNLSSVDSSEARKRKADRDAPSCRERTLARQEEGRFYPSSRGNLDPGADVRNRKAIESAKELLGVQDKENINPCYNYHSHEVKKQVSDRSIEKRRLQVSRKLQNATGSRKVGSLLVKQPVKPKAGSLVGGVTQPSVMSQDSFMEKKQLRHVSTTASMASSRAESMSSVQAHHQGDSDVLTPVDSMSISQPLQSNFLSGCRSNDAPFTDRNGNREEISPVLRKQDGSKTSPLVGSHAEVQEISTSSALIESNQRGVVSTSVKELSSSMNGLAIADSHLDLQSPLLPEKAEVKRDLVQSGKNIQGSFILDAKQYEANVQVGAPAACPSSLPAISVPSATAWSYTLRTSSAPLRTSLTEESVQPLSQQIVQPSSKDSFPLKSSQAMSVSRGKANEVKMAETHSPVRPILEENDVIKAGQDGASREDVPMSDVGAGKLIQHLHLPEKKAISGGEATLQPRKQGENEHFVWVNGRRYQKLKKIGRGGSSEVYKVIDREGNIYALKRIKLKGRDYATADGFYQEIELLARLQGNSYIIRLIDHEVTDKNLFSIKLEGSHIIRHDAYIYMVLEFGEVDLATMLQDKLKERLQGENVDETWLRFYWRQILEAVNTVHEERIIHADLKPANFLLVKGVLKLIDFGIAKPIQGDTTNIERDAQVGTLNYMSPEAFLMNEKDEYGNVIKCGRPSDIWALGCILYQMVYGKTPFAHITALHAKIQEVANPNHKINFPPVSNPHLTDIMKKCLAYKREERLRIPELLNHPFLQPQMAQPVYIKKMETEILLQIQVEEQEGRDVRALTRLLEKVRLFEEYMEG
eukprot:c9419_g1_i1 orf=274-2952(+)